MPGAGSIERILMLEVMASALIFPRMSSSRNLFMVSCRKLSVIMLSASAYWRSTFAGVYVR